jgi:hypothetical protein
MNCRFRHLIAPVAVLAALACTSTAAASGTDVLRACLNEQSLDRFSDAEKRDALNQLAADQDEYSDCRSVIGAAIGSKKLIATASSNTPATAAAKQTSPRARKAKAQQARKARALRRVRARRVREEKLGPRIADPRDPGLFKAASTANGLPLPLLLAVIALTLLTLLGGLLALSRRNPRLAGVLRRVSLPRFRR